MKHLIRLRLHGVDDLRVEPHLAEKPLGPSDVRIQVRAACIGTSTVWSWWPNDRLPGTAGALPLKGSKERTQSFMDIRELLLMILYTIVVVVVVPSLLPLPPRGAKYARVPYLFCIELNWKPALHVVQIGIPL